jgi:hypothetical protein
MTLVRALSYVGAGCVVLLGWHLSDVGLRESALARFLSDPSHGIIRIAHDYGGTPDQCATDRTDDLYPLALAFLTVETFATPSFESWARAMAFHLATVVGVTPDISIGPGRIKPSAARMALHGSNSPSADDYRGMSDQDLARQLLEPCGSIRIAIEILEGIRRQNRKSSSRIDLKFIRLATTSYNGKSGKAGSFEATLSSEVYFDLVYAAFQHYRFALAGTPAE